MTDVMTHRGPDDRGCHVKGPIGLGHRRLSIVDLAGGHQPMGSLNGRIWVAFNGEIYNHAEIRARAERRGRSYRTQSDTESILHLYEETGRDCLGELHGMFALAIWDEPRRSLLLARDRLGIKPLYYADLGGKLVFASEIKSLLLHPGVSREIDPLALDSYLALQYVPAPRTIFSAVRKLPAGHFLVAGPEGVKIEAYWSLKPREAPATYEEGCEQFRESFRASIRERLMSDVPLGAFLSGGLDSSLVVASMAREMDRPVKTFSIGFDVGGWHSELPHAQAMANRIGAEHHEHVVRAVDIPTLLPEVTAQLDEPLADVAAIPTYLLSRFARESVKVCLTGEGADELFAGYRRYRVETAMLNFDAVPRSLRKVVSSLAATLAPASKKKLLRGLGLDQPDRFVQMRSVIPFSTRQALLQPEFAAALPGRHLERRMAGHFENGADLNTLLRADTLEWLPDDLLMKVDKMSMLTSLEARVPFLDHRLVETVAGFPTDWKYGRGQSKRMLKDVARGLVPDELIDRPKHGFMPPVGEWLTGELRGFVEELLGDPQALSTRYIRPSALRSWLNRLYDGERHLQVGTWILLCFEVWLRGVQHESSP